VTKKYSSEKELSGLVVSALSNYEAEIIDLNTSQLEQGKLSTGKDTEEYLSDNYAKFKKSIGSISSPKADLKLTGDFYDGFNIDFKSYQLIFESTDSKAPKLERQYSIDIYGLTDKNKAEALEYAKDDVINELNNEFTK
jgi:hypothetical protein